MFVANTIRRGLSWLAYPILCLNCELREGETRLRLRLMIVTVNLAYDGIKSSKLSQAIVLP